MTMIAIMFLMFIAIVFMIEAVNIKKEKKRRFHK